MPCPYQSHISWQPPLLELLELLLEELELLDAEVEEELDELVVELVLLPPLQEPRLVQEASLPGVELVYQFARYKLF